MGENDIYRIRPEHTHGGGLQICDDGSDGTRLSLRTRRNLRK